MVAIAKVNANGSIAGDITDAYSYEALLLNPNYKPHPDVYFLTLADAPFATLDEFKKKYIVHIWDVSTNPDIPIIETRRHRYSILAAYDQSGAGIVPFSLVTITDNV